MSLAVTVFVCDSAAATCLESDNPVGKKDGMDLADIVMRPLPRNNGPEQTRIVYRIAGVRGNIASMPSWCVASSDDLHHSTSDHAKGFQTLM